MIIIMSASRCLLRFVVLRQAHTDRKSAGNEFTIHLKFVWPPPPSPPSSHAEKRATYNEYEMGNNNNVATTMAGVWRRQCF